MQLLNQNSAKMHKGLCVKYSIMPFGVRLRHTWAVGNKVLGTKEERILTGVAFKLHLLKRAILFARFVMH